MASTTASEVPSISASVVARARYLADVSASQVFVGRPSTPPRRLRSPVRRPDATESVADSLMSARGSDHGSVQPIQKTPFEPRRPDATESGRLVSARGSDHGSVQPIQKTPFEPRWDLSSMTPRWNRVVELSSTRGLGASVAPRYGAGSAKADLDLCAAAASGHSTSRSEAECSHKAPQRQSSVPSLFCTHHKPMTGSRPGLGETPKGWGSLRGCQSSKASSKQSLPSAASVAKAVATATARVQSLVMEAGGGLQQDGRDLARSPEREASSSACRPSGALSPCSARSTHSRSAGSRSASARSLSAARSEAESEPRFNASDFNLGARGKAPRSCTRAPSAPAPGAPPPRLCSGSSVGSAFSWNSSAPRGAHKKPAQGTSATSSTRSGASGRPCSNSGDNMSSTGNAAAAIVENPSTELASGSALARGLAQRERHNFVHNSPRAASIDSEQQRAAGIPSARGERASSEARSSMHSLISGSARSPRQASVDIARKPGETATVREGSGGQTMTRASSEASLSQRRSPRSFGAGIGAGPTWNAAASSSRSSCPRSPAEAWESQAGKRSSVEPWQLSARGVREKLNRSTVLEQAGVYERAEKEQSWKVSELKLEKLPGTADERSLSRLCQAFGHQVVRVNTGWDPIKCSISEGRASLLLRSSADSNNTKDLTAFLESSLGCQVR